MSIICYEHGKLIYRGPRLPGAKGEFLGLTALVCFVVALLASSWRKWPDPLIDYGREIYIPWRLASGGKLFKDVDDLYGPLSRYFDAGLFKIFGSGIMVLAVANICIYGVILGLLYYLFKKAWGMKASFVSCFVFVGVFSFSQLTSTSNYNFITPYSQQVTHGFLICLILTALLPKWVRNASVKKSFWVGIMIGLTSILKPEFILTSGLMFGGAFVLRIKLYGVPSIRSILVGALGVVLPTFIFLIYFLSYLALKDAFFAACFAWLNGIFIWKDQLYAHVLNNFSGMDDPKSHLITHSLATLRALGFIAGIAGAALGLKSIKKVWFKHVLGLSIFLGVWLFAFNKVVWVNIGQCLLGLLSIYVLYRGLRIIRSLRDEDDSALVLRSILSLFALALMTRMVLNGRLYQYGFIQAAMATMVITATLWDELPSILRLDRISRGYIMAWVGIFITCGVGTTISQSQKFLETKTLAIGVGRDLFYGFPGGEIVKSISENLAKQPNDHTLIVIPEGIMVNYLSRKISPVSVAAFYTTPQLEAEILGNLKNNPPHWVVSITRDLSEYGVAHYGAKGNSGESINEWVKANYHTYATIGGDPLITTLYGGSIYEINTATKKTELGTNLFKDH